MTNPDIHATDLRQDEMRAVIASVFGLPPEQVEDWLIIVKRPCAKCGRPYCADGAVATAGSRGLVWDDGTVHDEPAFELHLMAVLIDALAERWADRK